ncbi:hypothetical protein Tco_0117756 [Tanacetum coccineum]
MGEDEAVHKELGDSLVRDATTASSLEAERTMVTSIRLDPRQHLMNLVPKELIQLVVPGNTLRSDEDRLKLDEFMALCSTLQNRVLDLEKTKTSQHNEISSLKRRVKKLEKKNRASKHGRIDAIDADEEITLVSVHDEMEVNEEVVEVINTPKLIIDVAQVSVAGDKVSAASAATTTTTTTVDGITLAQVLEEMKSIKPKTKRVVIQELAEFDEEERLAREKAKKEQKANIALIETWDDIQNIEGYKLKDLKSKGFDSIQEMFDRAFKRVNTFEDFRTELVEGKEKREKAELVQESTKKQNVEDDKETTEIKKLMEIVIDEEEVEINAIPLAVKSPSIVD